MHIIQGILPTVFLLEAFFGFRLYENSAPALCKLKDFRILNTFFLSFSQLGQWRVRSCEEEFKYVCKKKGDILNETKSDKSCSLEEVTGCLYFFYFHFVQKLHKITFFLCFPFPSCPYNKVCGTFWLKKDIYVA